GRLDVFLSKKTGQSRQFIQSQITKGSVFLNSRPILKASQKLKPGDHVSGDLVEEEPFALTPIEGPLEILWEDENLLVLNKAQGVVVHPATGHRGATLVHHLLHYLKNDDRFRASSPTRPGIVHRLDRGTSGCLLVAKTRIVQERLSKLFKD